MGLRDLISGYVGLGENINKAKEEEGQTKPGSIGALVPELTLEMPDEEILSLTRKWEESYRGYVADVLQRQEETENYWLGKHYQKASFSSKERPIVDNVMFEALETFLPEATKRSPEPMITADNTDEGQALAELVKNMLVFQADRQRMRLKLKKMTRYWALYFIGVAKIGWDTNENDIATTIIRPQKLILDKDATIEDACVYNGDYIGEYKESTATDLIGRFPDAVEYITAKVEGNMGTKVTYAEWWTKDGKMFYTCGDKVLAKYKNPHWNYDSEEMRTDEFGNEIPEMVKGSNHFNMPEMPYVFLSIFNLGKHPHDDTSLMFQNLANQDIVNKRNKQIDKNADNMNNGIVLSGDAFTKDQATEASEVLSKGGALFVAQGDVNKAYKRDQAPPLSSDVFNDLNDKRNELRNIFGIRGSTPQGIGGEKTVRGKIITKDLDSSRIGGGVSEYIEQVADKIFNWWVQMMYVYYTEPHKASILGPAKAQEEIILQSSDLNRKLAVSVKEGSLIPKDSLTQQNQAMDLWDAQALDPITLFDKLDFPNPRESAKQLYIWMTNPGALFPEIPPPMPMMPDGSVPPTEQVPPEMATQDQMMPPEMAPEGGDPMSSVPLPAI